MNAQLLEKLTRSALKATLRFHFFSDHLSESKIEEFSDLLMPDLLPMILEMATRDQLNDEMWRVVYYMTEAFHERYRACAIREKR